MAKEIINVYEELYQRKQYTWSDAVKKGKIITVGGMVSTDENHHTLHPGDLEAQMREIYEQLKPYSEKRGLQIVRF